MASARCVRPIFRMSFHCGGLFGQHLAASLQGGNQPLVDRRGHGHVDGRGKDVVGALAEVDVVVRMDRLLGAEAVAAGKFDRPIGDHLVGVHVARGAGAGLKDVDGELVVELAVGHFAAGGQQGIDLLIVSGVCPSRRAAQVAIDPGRRPLHQPQGVDQLGRQGPAGNGEVLHGPLRLCAVVGLWPAGGLRPSNRIMRKSVMMVSLSIVFRVFLRSKS